MKQDWKMLIAKLEKEIGMLQDEIKKREAIVVNIKSLQSVTGMGVTRRRPGRKPGVKVLGRKPGRKPGRKRGPGRPPMKKRPGRPPRKAGRAKPTLKTADVMADILSKMSQPASIDALAEKMHQQYPKLGGIKYRSVVASITSRDNRFQRVKGNKVSLKK